MSRSLHTFPDSRDTLAEAMTAFYNKTDISRPNRCVVTDVLTHLAKKRHEPEWRRRVKTSLYCTYVTVRWIFTKILLAFVVGFVVTSAMSSFMDPSTVSKHQREEYLTFFWKVKLPRVLEVNPGNGWYSNLNWTRVQSRWSQK